MITFTNIKHAFRKNMVLLFATLGLLVSISLVIYYSEQNFITEKNRYIIQNRELFFGEIMEEINRLDLLMQTFPVESLSEHIVQLQRDLQNIVENPDNIVYRIELKRTPESTLINIQNPDKLKQMNHFGNSLFWKGFSRFITSKSRISETVIYYTSPPADPQIEKLVNEYRKIVYPILLILLGIYAASLHWFILPVRRVIDKLEGIKEQFASKINNPRTLIEYAYNNMARNTHILNINLQMIDLVATRPNLPLEQLLEIFLDKIRVIFPESFILQFHESEDKKIPYRFGENPQPIQMDNINEFIKLKNNAGMNKIRFGEGMIQIGWIENIGIDSWYFCHPVASVESDELEDRALLSLLQEIRLVIQSKELQRQYVEKEKSQVSIHLARNLGHDVTNIIASIRWDLDTIHRLISRQLDKKAPVDADINPEIISESLAGLTHGTELLQEIVDIYRSFMYLEKPNFEPIRLEPILVRLCELFRRATTHRIVIKTDFAPDLPEPVWEPRLFKLAIFNLLTNSLESIKKASQSKSVSGEIELSVYPDESKKNIIISVQDNGTGLWDADDKLLSEHETAKLFQYGYSTKRANQSGLGLAWVHTIIIDIHQGIIMAKNLSTGGAQFQLIIPVHRNQSMKKNII